MKSHPASLPPTAAAGLTQRYGAGLRRRYLLLAALAAVTLLLGLQAVAVGSYDLSPFKVLMILLGRGEGASDVVVWNIRLPRITAALVTGWGLGLSGLMTQSLLRNPLASPFTLGMSHGAMFGAAFAIVFMGAGEVTTAGLYTADTGMFMFSSLYAVTLMAFAGAMLATGVILLLARMRQMSASSVILAGVAMSSLFMSGTILVQYFATETEIATVVFWTFGDVARSNWQEIGLLGVATLLVSAYFLRRRWDLNALLAGEETASGLGVNVTSLRLVGMLLASLLVALATAFHGIIAFLGLLAPHISRRLVGGDHRLLVPCSGLVGALLLIAADTIGRLLVGSGSLPVGVLTSFMGAPLFLYLLLKGDRR
ncbi:MAG: iron ABC transporter permease [Desulfarculaceae bacterium]|nr:iron ABC transporter permease [Desulfarculaceae bacterium]